MRIRIKIITTRIRIITIKMKIITITKRIRIRKNNKNKKKIYQIYRFSDKKWVVSDEQFNILNREMGVPILMVQYMYLVVHLEVYLIDMINILQLMLVLRKIPTKSKNIN